MRDVPWRRWQRRHARGKENGRSRFLERRSPSHERRRAFERDRQRQKQNARLQEKLVAGPNQRSCRLCAFVRKEIELQFMSHHTMLLVLLILFSAALIGVLVLRPSMIANAGGKMLAFLLLFLLPLLCLAMGVS